MAAERAADALQPHAHTLLGLQVLGMLSLHAALGAAVVQRPHVVSHWLGEADQLAAQVPDDLQGNWQSFGQTNVGLWRIAIGVERGESGGAVLDMARTVDRAKLNWRNREAAYLADVGRGLARDRKTRAESVDLPGLHRRDCQQQRRTLPEGRQCRDPGAACTRCPAWSARGVAYQPPSRHGPVITHRSW